MPKKKENLMEKLGYKTKCGWEGMKKKEKDGIFKFIEGYKSFLDDAKTEVEAIDYIREAAKKNGFVEFSDDAKSDKLYFEFHKKTAFMVYKGKKPLKEGARIVVSHVDAPRIDLKQNPLYEDTGFAMLDTHYYGGIKKYQWLSLPLALHGVVVKENGEEIKIVIGEKETDPVLVIPDLLPHLAAKQMGGKAREIIPGEKLNIIASATPFDDKDTKEKFKLYVLNYLNENFGMTEEDFLSAEFEVVPASKSRDVGFDKTLMGAYGQDDRVCAYTSLQAVLDMEEKPEYTSIIFFADKEEIGSDSSTGAKSNYIERVFIELLNQNGETEFNALIRAMNNSEVFSADVNAAINPNFQEVHEKKNACQAGHGIVVTKFTGVRGKGGSNDAHPQFLGKIRKMFKEEGVVWQTAELGKVDQGGGGTIAKFMAEYGMYVIDVGVGVLGMHAPFEVTSKFDVYHAYKAFKAFLKN